MTILIPHESSGNLYILELAYAYERLGHHVILGRENLLYLNHQIDVLHIHWPEALYRVSYESLNKHQMALNLITLLERLKTQGTKIVFTIHNLIPHETHDQNIAEHVYKKIWELADIIVHHCKESVELWNKKYKTCLKKTILVIPHGHYFEYGIENNKRKCTEYVGIKDDCFIFLVFGLIRGYKGINNIITAFMKAKVKKKKLLVVGKWVGSSNYKNILRWKLWKHYCSVRGVRWHLRKIANDEIRYFLGACNAVVLGHIQGLNSGVAILGMTYGKPVIGPNVGCIGEVLRQGMNVIYKAGDIKDLTNAMEQASKMDLKTAKIINQAAATRWSWDNMASQILNALNN